MTDLKFYISNCFLPEFDECLHVLIYLCAQHYLSIGYELLVEHMAKINNP